MCLHEWDARQRTDRRFSPIQSRRSQAEYLTAHMKYEMLEFRPQNPALAIYTEANKIVLQGPSDWIISTIMEVQTLNS